VTYNGRTMDDFVVERASTYIEQVDEHMAELTCAFCCSPVQNMLHLMQDGCICQFKRSARGKGIGALGETFSEQPSHNCAAATGASKSWLTFHVFCRSVRETIDFAARVQGTGVRVQELQRVRTDRLCITSIPVQTFSCCRLLKILLVRLSFSEDVSITRCWAPRVSQARCLAC
jgi:hypothetical protein